MYKQPIKDMREALAERDTIKRPDYAGIGALLEDARESQNISLEQTAQDLHIKTSYIVAIEQGRLENIPGIAYAKGYLRMYASYLGVNLDTMLTLVAPESKVRPMASVSAASQEPKRLQVAVLVSLTLLAVLLGIWRFSGFGEEEAETTPVRPVPEAIRPPATIRPAVPVASACLWTVGHPGWPPCYAGQGRGPEAPKTFRTVMQVAGTDFTFLWMMRR